MTDARPEITARADGVNVVLANRYHINTPAHIVRQEDGTWLEEIPLSPQECFALQCQLSAAMEKVNPNALIVVDGMEPTEEAKVKFREWF